MPPPGLIGRLALLVLFVTGTHSAEPLELHLVPTSIQSYRLLAMSMDDDGFIWCGSIHRVVHRYDPRTGETETIAMPFDSSAASCICAGHKVYILGQNHPKLIIYDRQARTFSEAAYPSEKPDVWYGTPLLEKRYIYLFDRGSVGVIKWDTTTDTGTTIPFPYPMPLPSGGHYEPADRAIWCKLWDYTHGQYVPRGIARFDVATNAFTGVWDFPQDDAQLADVTDPEHTFYLPWTLRGMLVPFDFKAKRWCRFIPVPRFGELFGFIGLSTPYRGKHYFSLSTYDGDATGVDGKPYHFCNALLEFDPRTREFTFPTLTAPGAYYQVAYTLAAQGGFFATGANIQLADGTLDQATPGACVFWQTTPSRKK